MRVSEPCCVEQNAPDGDNRLSRFSAVAAGGAIHGRSRSGRRARSFCVVR